MKRVLSVVLQFILFLAVFLVGSLLPGANLLPMLSVGAGAGRVFVYDGVLLMFALYVLILLIAAARKRIHSAWPNSTVALAIALILGLAMKFGFKSI
jgi:hypothetical protein